MTWTLANVEERAKLHPETFEIPHRRIRECMSVGNFVKLVFEAEERGERMWVVITEHCGRRYRGRLDNQPAVIEGLRKGEIIEFGPEHVAAWSP